MDTKPIPFHPTNSSVASDPFVAFRAIEGRPYTDYSCFDVATYLYSQRYGVNFPELLNNKTPAFSIREIWFRGQPDRPTTLIEPWDICLFAIERSALDHMGVVLSSKYFATAREEAGVVKERFEKWADYLLQVARIAPRVAHV